FVRVAIELATSSDAEITDRVGVKWISPSQTQSMPQASATSASSNASSNAETAVAPRRISSTKSPKCMASEVIPRGFRPVHPVASSGGCLAQTVVLAYTERGFRTRGGHGVSQDKAELVEILRQMIMIREFDLLAVELRTAKRIYGALHPY